VDWLGWGGVGKQENGAHTNNGVARIQCFKWSG